MAKPPAITDYEALNRLMALIEAGAADTFHIKKLIKETGREAKEQRQATVRVKEKRTLVLMEDEIYARLARFVLERRLKKDWANGTISKVVNRALDKWMTSLGF